MPEKAKFTADEVACYLTMRLMGSNKTFHPEGRKGWLKEKLRRETVEDAQYTELDPFRRESILSNVLATARERQDLIRQIAVDSRSEEALGQLIYFFEKAIALSGYLLRVNPFDQPGVEAYKKNMFALLGKKGYEKQREALAKRIKEVTGA